MLKPSNTKKIWNLTHGTQIPVKKLAVITSVWIELHKNWFIGFGTWIVTVPNVFVVRILPFEKWVFGEKTCCSCEFDFVLCLQTKTEVYCLPRILFITHLKLPHNFVFLNICWKELPEKWVLCWNWKYFAFVN